MEEIALILVDINPFSEGCTLASVVALHIMPRRYEISAEIRRVV